MNHFKGIITLEDLKKRYKILAKTFHPDMPNGNLAIMQEINAQYDRLFPVLKNRANKEADADHQTNEMQDDYKNIINALIEMVSIEVELCGSWLWIKNKLESNKTQLKKIGCGYSKTKDLWYWRPSTNAHHGKSGATIGDIRKKYGSEAFGNRATKSNKKVLAIA
jgi:hypothetical protein